MKEEEELLQKLDDIAKQLKGKITYSSPMEIVWVSHLKQ